MQTLPAAIVRNDCFFVFIGINNMLCAVAVLAPGRGGGAQAPPVLLQAPQFRGQPWFFCKDNTLPDLFAFPDFIKMDKFAVFLKSSETESVLQLEGAFFPNLWAGALPWTPLGALS